MTVSNFGIQTIAIQKYTRILTDAEIRALPTTAIAILPSPGAGYFIHPLFWVLRADFSLGAYADIDAAAFAYINYIGFAAEAVSAYIGDDGATTPVLDDFTLLFGFATDQVLQLNRWMRTWDPADSGWGVTGIPYASGDIGNRGLELTVDNGATGDLTGGNAANTLTIDTYFLTLKLP